MSENILQVLKSRELQYKTLRNHWETVQEKILASSGLSGLGSYSATLVDASCIRQEIYGVVSYLRFRHCFKKAVVEYVITGAGDENYQRGRVVCKLGFDMLGNLAEPYNEYSVNEFLFVNFKMLSHVVDELIPTEEDG